MVAIYTLRNGNSELAEVGRVVEGEIRADNPVDHDLIYRWSLKLGTQHPTEEDWLRRYADGTFIRAKRIE